MQLLKSRSQVKFYVNSVLIFDRTFFSKKDRVQFVNSMIALFEGVREMHYDILFYEPKITSKQRLHRSKYNEKYRNERKIKSLL